MIFDNMKKKGEGEKEGNLDGSFHHLDDKLVNCELGLYKKAKRSPTWHLSFWSFNGIAFIYTQKKSLFTKEKKKGI